MRDLEMLKEKLFAHRGIHNDKVKENTIMAFEKAIASNCAIELDVQLTKDDKVIVFHDESLQRMMGIDKKIKTLTYKELQDIATYGIPTLNEVLNIINNKVPVLIELKPYHNKYKLEKLLVNILDKYKGRFAIQSFNPYTVYWFKKNRPDYIRGQLVTNNYNFNYINNIIYKRMLFNYLTKPDFISYNIKELPNKIISKNRNKYIILGWTIRSKKDLKKYQKDCDNFICENVL